MLNRRQVVKTISAAAAVGTARIASAQQLPSTVKIIVVVPPGASMDNVARLVADRLKDTIRRNVIVEYKPGGTGLVASQFLKSTEPTARM